MSNGALIGQRVDAAERHLARWIPDHLVGPGYNPSWFVRFAHHQLQEAFRRDKDLELIPASVTTALVTFAMAGILPNPVLGHGYLIPYRAKNSGWSVLTPIFGYKGLIHLARRANIYGLRIREVRADVLMEGETLDPDLPIEEALRRHHPGQDRNPGSLKGLEYAYTLVRAVDSEGDFWMSHLMPRGDVELIRARAKAQKGPWKDWPLRMAPKCSTRRMITTGQVPVDYVAGVAVAVESAAEGGDGRAMRAGFQANPGTASNYVDEAAHEVAEMLEMERDAIDVDPPPEVSDPRRPQGNGVTGEQIAAAIEAANTPADFSDVAKILAPYHGPDRDALHARWRERKQDKQEES